MRATCGALLILLAGLCPGAQASAQQVAGNVNSYATIAEPPLTGGGVRSLSFGPALAAGGSFDTGPGSEANTNSAKWEIGALRKSTSIAISFTFPTLQKSGVILPIDWSQAGYAAACARLPTETVAACTTLPATQYVTFAPSAGTSVTTPGGGGNNNRVLTVWAGATIGPVPANAPAGLYTGVVTLTIVY